MKRPNCPIKQQLSERPIPVTSLKRGFSLVYTDGGELVKSLSQIQVADTLKTEVSDGRIISTVNKTERK